MCNASTGGETSAAPRRTRNRPWISTRATSRPTSDVLRPTSRFVTCTFQTPYPLPSASVSAGGIGNTLRQKTREGQIRRSSIVRALPLLKIHVKVIQVSHDFGWISVCRGSRSSEGVVCGEGRGCFDDPVIFGNARAVGTVRDIYILFTG